MRCLPAALAVILLTTVCSCSETDRITGTVIGPEGGTVTGPEGAMLQIPAGALDQEIEIWVVKTSGSPAGFHPTGDIYEFGPSGTVFASPVTVSLPYDESSVLGAETAVSIWWSLSMDGTWGPLEGSADTARNTVTGLATHFSFGAPGEPLGGCQPDCGTRVCGPDPVCQTSCGTCGENQTCSAAGGCECAFLSCGGSCCADGQVCYQSTCCSPDCGARLCGSDPACGTDCGQCDQGDFCTLDGRCVPAAQGPRVCPDPITLDFGNVQPGDTKELSFNLKNCGIENLELMNVSLDPASSSDFSLRDLPVFPQVLAPDAAVDIMVRYSPPAFGSDHGGVEIYSNDPASDPQTHFTGTVPLLGASAIQVCDVGVTPAAVNFGTVVSGQTDGIDLILTNQGGDTCTFADAQITSNSPDLEFSIVSAPAPNTDFAPGQTLQVRLQYAPVNLGADAGGLLLSAGDPDGDIPVDLAGEGVATAVCDLQVTPLTIEFGTVRPGHTSTAFITLQNTGTDDCTVSAIELELGVLFPGEFVLTNAQTPLVVDRAGQPNSTFLIEVVFAPTQLDMHSAKVWITADDPDLQQSGNMNCSFPTPPQPGQACVPVTGTCAASRIEVIPTEMDFGVVTVGCNSPQSSVTVYNLDAATLNINDIYLGDPVDPNFEFASAPALPHQLAGGGSIEIRMLYHPQDAAPHGGMLYIGSDATNAALLSVPLLGQGTAVTGQTDVFLQHTNVKTDVLFVVDNSGSMGEEQAALAQNFPSFISRAIALNADFHVGVIATEVNDAETGVGSPPRDIFPGVLVKAPGCPKIITNNTPDIAGCFTDNVNLGTCCSDEQEAGLQAAWMSLTPPLVDDPTSNAGFMRGDAKLYVICVSDEQDQSAGSTDFYVDFFNSIKGPHNIEMMKTSAICGDCPDGCGGEQAECGSRYIEVANRTGGIFESICTSNWAQVMDNLAVDAFCAVREFPLSRPADPATIQVTADATPVPQAGCPGCPDGWTFYSETNSVYFGENVEPPPGSQIEVTYTAACL